MHDFYTQIGKVLIRCAYASYNFVCFDWKTLNHFKAHTVEKHMAQNIHQFLRYFALTSDFYLFDSSILKMYLSSCCCFENSPYISSAWRINAILFMFLANDAGESQQKKAEEQQKIPFKICYYTRDYRQSHRRLTSATLTCNRQLISTVYINFIDKHTQTSMQLN